VRAARALLIIAALGLVSCAAPAATSGRPEPALAAAPSVPAVPAPEPPRQADHLARIASELTEIQNAVAKLMMSARQHDDQLLYLQRRLSELENQTRGRSSVPPGFAPSAGVPAPLPPPPAAPMPLPPPVTAAPVAPPAPPSAPAASTLPPVSAPRAETPRTSSPLPAVAARSTLAPSRPTAPTPTPSLGSGSTAEALYQSGLAKYQSGELDAAVVTLYEVVANHPGDPARERAQLLVGEIFLAQKDYRGAVAELEGLIAAVPSGSRVPDALLKLGMAHRFLGDESKARRAWERIVKEYPASAPARQARTLLKGAKS
jgi:TolA-binding protein